MCLAVRGCSRPRRHCDGGGVGSADVASWPNAFASGMGRYRDRAKGRKREGSEDNARGDESGKMVDQ